MEWPPEFEGQFTFRKRVTADLEVSKAIGRPFRFSFVGPPGTGKTTGAKVIAESRGMHFREVLPSDNLDSVMVGVDHDWDDEPGVLFCDEFHLFSKANVGRLLPLTDTRMTYITSGKNGGHYEFPNMSVIVATTEWNRLKPDIQSRFSVYQFARLSVVEAGSLMARYAKREFKYVMPLGVVSALAPRLYGNGREATNFARAAFAVKMSGERVTERSVLFQLGLKESGLTDAAEEHLVTIRKVGRGGAVTRKVVADSLGLGVTELGGSESELLGKGLIVVVNGLGQALTDEGRKLAKEVIRG